MGKLNVAIADDNEVMRDLLEEMVTSDDELHLILSRTARPSSFGIIISNNTTSGSFSLTGSGQIIH